MNLCKLYTQNNSFEEIVELSKKGDLEKIDLRIKDATDKEITTLPLDLTLANFGKLKEDVKKEDIILGIINMVFETIGMMAAFSLKNDTIKEVVLIGNIVKIPRVKEILEKIEKLQGISFIIPENPEFAVAIGAIKITNH
ncbi:MAG: Hsp70 family protein [Clostridia bacterium]|nr:Hsp70 family protein [Clostridia bacterium]